MMFHRLPRLKIGWSITRHGFVGPEVITWELVAQFAVKMPLNEGSPFGCEMILIATALAQLRESDKLELITSNCQGTQETTFKLSQSWKAKDAK
jgi:hypothetical protein